MMTALPWPCDRHLDLRGLACPLPVLKARKALLGMAPGQTPAGRGGRSARRDRPPPFLPGGGPRPPRPGAAGRHLAVPDRARRRGGAGPTEARRRRKSPAVTARPGLRWAKSTAATPRCHRHRRKDHRSRDRRGCGRRRSGATAPAWKAPAAATPGRPASTMAKTAWSSSMLSLPGAKSLMVSTLSAAELAVENEGVGTLAADQACPSPLRPLQRIRRRCAAIEGVIAGTANQGVGLGLAAQHVIAVADPRSSPTVAVPLRALLAAAAVGCRELEHLGVGRRRRNKTLFEPSRIGRLEGGVVGVRPVRRWRPDVQVELHRRSSARGSVSTRTTSPSTSQRTSLGSHSIR